MNMQPQSQSQSQLLDKIRELANSLQQLTDAVGDGQYESNPEANQSLYEASLPLDRARLTILQNK